MTSPASADLGSPTPLDVASPLSFLRLHLPGGPTPSALPAALSTQMLGGRWVGNAPEALDMPLLAQPAGAAILDAWLAESNGSHGRHGCVRYVSDGHWLYGRAVIDNADEDAQGLQACAQRAYAEVFAVLAASGYPHLLRLWNYLADINLETGGVERYRQFNAGRQEAFLEARRSAFDGSPAACALGTVSGPLEVSFLAGRQAPIAIENPRQVSAYRYPDIYGAHAPTFSRAAVAEVGGGRQMLFISGTAAIVGHQSVHAGDVRRQTDECLVNLAAVREAAQARVGLQAPADQLTYTVYVRDPADLPVVREVFESAVGRGSPAAQDTLYVQADICRAELLVEIEAHGLMSLSPAWPQRSAA